MGKLTISMAMFNSYVKLPEGTPIGVAAESWGSHGCPVGSTAELSDVGVILRRQKGALGGFGSADEMGGHGV